MKESLSLYQPLHQRILEGYEQKLIKYLPNMRRRGTAGLKGRNDGQKIIQSAQKDSANGQVGQQDCTEYPYSALGVVTVTIKEETRVSVGAIIHPNLIITALPSIFTSTSSFEFRPLCAIRNQQLFAAKKIHPSNLQRIRSTAQLSMEQQKGEESVTHCIMLQFNKKTNLENEYGSLGISFVQEKPTELLLLGVVETYREYRVYSEPLQIVPSTSPNHLSYRMNSDRHYLAGSLIVDKSGSQLVIKGIHLESQVQQGLGIRLTKERWEQFSKMTFKGASIDLSHEHMSRKGIHFLSQLNLKKVCELYLQRSLISNAQLQIICRLDYHLTELNLGHNSIDNDGMNSLVNADWSLNSIFLTKNSISFEGIRTLSKNKWRDLRLLWLDQNPIGNKGVKFLVQCDCTNIKNLNLSKIGIDDSGCDGLRKGRWPHLTDMDLNHNKIGLRGARYMINANWKQLARINLASNCLGFEGAKQFVKAEWKSIKTIGIDRNDPGRMYRTPADRSKAIVFAKQIIKNKFVSVLII